MRQFSTLHMTFRLITCHGFRHTRVTRPICGSTLTCHQSQMDSITFFGHCHQQSRSMVWRSNNKRGVDPSVNERIPDETKLHVDISLEDVEESIAQEKREKEEAHIAFIKNSLNRKEPPDNAPWDVIHWKSWIHNVCTELDFQNNIPDNLKNVNCVWTHYSYPPYLGYSKEKELQEHPHHTVTVFIPIDQFNWTPTQFERFKHLVSVRYKPDKREVVLKSSNFDSTLENFERVKHMFTTLLEEVQKVK